MSQFPLDKIGVYPQSFAGENGSSAPGCWLSVQLCFTTFSPQAGCSSTPTRVRDAPILVKLYVRVLHAMTLLVLMSICLRFCEEERGVSCWLHFFCLVRILDSNQDPWFELFFCLTERGDFFHVECALWDHLACTALLWLGLLHVHPLPSAQSDSVSFHFPVIFTAHISSHRQPLAWFSKASGHISPLCYYYLSILLGLCCTWLAIRIKLAMT